MTDNLKYKTPLHYGSRESAEAKKKKLFVFVDFDGTISYKDIGDELFKDNGKFEPFHGQLVAKEISIKQYWHALWSNLREGVSEKSLREYALKFEIDEQFKRLVKLCQDEGIPIKILSDGFDIYIDPILQREGLGHLKYNSNRIDFSNSIPVPIFPGASESCQCMCASCKRNAMLNELQDDSIAIYIGDGYSDYCVAQHSDIIFAKKHLAAYCSEHKLPHYPYSNFFDVYRIMTTIILKGKMKQRNQAKQLRKLAYETE